MTKTELKQNLQSILEITEIGAAEQGISKEDYYDTVDKLIEEYLDEYRKARAFDRFLTW